MLFCRTTTCTSPAVRVSTVPSRYYTIRNKNNFKPCRPSSWTRLQNYYCNWGAAASTYSTADTLVLRKNHGITLSPLSSTMISIRFFSSKNDDKQQHQFQLDALTFSVSPQEALDEFGEWARKEQGLGPLLLRSATIGASYVPVWSFDLNVRFVTQDENNKRRYDVKAEPFESSYQAKQQPVIYVPGLSAYAGFTYQRSLMNPIHNTTLVFMGDKVQKFGTWMLKDIQFVNSNNEKQTLQIFPDPWNATRGRALSVVKQELQALGDTVGAEVQTQVVGSKRVYMPTYVIDYKVLGLSYQAFVSGCDAGSGVSGVSHKVLPGSGGGELQQAAGSFLTGAANVVRSIGPRHLGTFILMGLNFILNIAGRLLTRIPIISVVGGAVVGFRKLLQPYVSNAWNNAAWERQREHESLDDTATPVDDFVDTTGAAKRYFDAHHQEILNKLSGKEHHQEGDFDWYKQWEEWARKQYEAQQRQQQEAYQRAYGYQQQQQQRQGQYQRQKQKQAPRQKQAPPKPNYHWDFDPNDPYSVLGIPRGSTKEQVSAAFRREMLKHHPDVHANASEAEKNRAVERSKLITEAYRKIKAQMKGQ